MHSFSKYGFSDFSVKVDTFMIQGLLGQGKRWLVPHFQRPSYMYECYKIGAMPHGGQGWGMPLYGFQKSEKLEDFGYFMCRSY